MSDFHAEVPQATASEGLAYGPYEVATAGFEPATLRTKGVESTNEQTCPTHSQAMTSQKIALTLKRSVHTKMYGKTCAACR